MKRAVAPCTLVARILVATLTLVLADVGAARPATDTGRRTAVIVSINDVYNVQGIRRGHAGGLARVRALLREIETIHGEPPLFLHAGDALFPSLPSGPERDGNVNDGGKGMIEVLDALVPDATGATPSNRMMLTVGNHEFDRGECADAAELVQRMAESRFLWLADNIEFDFARCHAELTPDAAARLRTGDAAGRPQPDTLVTVGGIRIGVFGLTTGMTQPDYVRRFAEPREVAKRRTAELRQQGAEVVIALTHLDVAEDRRILTELGRDGPDLIVGGHDHESMQTFVAAEPDDAKAPWTAGRRQRAVFKADAEARSANVIVVTIENGKTSIDRELRTLEGQRPAPDAEVRKLVDGLIEAHEKRFCDAHRPDAHPVDAHCLEQPVGKAGTDVVGDETVLRSAESSLGNWLADLIAEQCGTEVAFLNAGSIRLNDTIPAGESIRLRDVENMVRYPADLVRLTIDGATLRKVIAHATSAWPGNGHWLATSGIAFVHQPTAPGMDVAPARLTLVKQRRALRDDDRIQIATTSFLAGGGDDYAMLKSGMIGARESCRDPSSLKELVLAALERSQGGIVPVVDGRVCRGDGPCLAVGDAPVPPDGPGIVAWLVLAVFLAMLVAVLAS